MDFGNKYRQLIFDILNNNITFFIYLWQYIFILIYFVYICIRQYKQLKNTTIMKTKDLLFLFISLVLFSCEGEIIDKSLGSRPANINATISNTNNRMTGDSWENGDAIGMYMKKENTNLNAGVLADNIKYVTTGSSTFSPANPDEEILFPFNGSNVDFIAYFPYKEEITNYTYPLDITNQNNQSALDLLYSNNAIGLNSTNPNVNLTFSHQMAKVILKITPENPTADLSDIIIKITNASLKAPFSLSDGSLSSPTEIGDLFFKKSTDGKFAEAILIPMSNLTGRTLVFTIGSDTYIYDLGSNTNITSFDKGTKYTFNIVINPTGVIASVSSSSIESWDEVAEEDIAILPGNDPGSVTSTGEFDNPISVTDAPIFLGQKDMWVKGFVVGYYSSTSYTSFVNNATDVTSTSTIALALTPTETDPKKTLPVQLPTGTIRDILNLQDNPQNLGKEIMVRGDISNYYGLVGLKNTDRAFIDGVEYP